MSIHLRPKGFALVQKGVATLILCMGMTSAGLACNLDAAAWKKHAPIGINIAGPAFTPTKLPGRFEKDYTYPTADELDYWRSQGVGLLRVTFQWERLQPALFKPFDKAELGRLKALLRAAGKRGFKVITGPHNYARYSIKGFRHLIGTSQVPVSGFADFWQRATLALADEPALYAFALMNEPHDTGGRWPAAAKAGVEAIRKFDNRHTVIVPGDDWSSARRWKQANPDLLIKDPANCLMYEAHLYFDSNGSGFYRRPYEASGAYPAIGANHVMPFIDWLNENGQIGIVTEFGVPNNDPRWLVVLDKFLTAIRAHGVGGTYWAAGGWWGDYPLSIAPKKGKPAPALEILSKHFGPVPSKAGRGRLHLD